MTRGFSFSLPVMVVVSAIAFVYFCTVFVFIDRWFGLMTSPGIMNAVAFTGVAVMCVLNYVFAIFMDPGRVPSNFLPDIEDSKVPIHEIKRKVRSENMNQLDVSLILSMFSCPEIRECLIGFLFVKFDPLSKKKN